MSTEIKIMETVLYAGMPAKNAFFILTFMREDRIDVSYETDLHAGLSGEKLNATVAQVLGVLLRALGKRTTSGKNAPNSKM